MNRTNICASVFLATMAWVCVGLMTSSAQSADRKAAGGVRCAFGADMNEDGVIDFSDLIFVIAAWGPCDGCRADINDDGVVNFADMLAVLSKWGPVEDCPECDDDADNDEDGLTDAEDPGCWNVPGLPFTYNPELDDESVATSAAQDGLDNDSDGKTDWPDDPGCGNPQVLSEVEREDPDRLACSDGLDNDNDGKVDWDLSGSGDPYCSNPFDTSEQDVLLVEIPWNDFEEFHLADDMTVTYGGLGLYPSQYYRDRDDFGDIPLRRGFSHVKGRLVNPEDREVLPFEKRAAGWGPAGSHTQHPINDEPWQQIRSPWDFDTDAYHTFWNEHYMERIADDYVDSRGTGVPKVDLMTSDIETHWIKDEQILSIKDDLRVPLFYRNLSDEQFIDRYKRDMAALYDHAIMYPRTETGTQAKLSSYNEVPITRYYGASSWEEWTTDFSLVNYLLYDHNDPGEGFYHNFGELVSTMDFFCVSLYQTGIYPPTYEGREERWESQGRYLARALFLIDVNREWLGPEKDIITYHWMRAHGSSNDRHHGIDPPMAHALAIFPFFSPNAGVHIFDWDGYHKTREGFEHITDEMQSEARHAYGNFLYGMYRLSEYNAYFEGDYQTHHPMNAWDLSTTRTPVWRGIIRGNQMLVAAHNPYAAPGETTEFVIEYNDQTISTVQTTGLNTYLGVCYFGPHICVGDEGLGGE